MGLFDGCLLVSDIDGTLLHDGIIPDENIKAVEWFKSEGGIFAIATGRAVPAAKYSYELSKSNAPLIALNGGVIYDFENEKFLYEKSLDLRCVDIVFDILEKFPTVGAEFFNGLDIYLIRGNGGTKQHSEYEHFKFKELPPDFKSMPWGKVLFAFEDFETLTSVEEYTKSLNVDFCRFIVTATSERARFFEVLPKGINKGTAIKELKRLCKAKYSFGIGDFFNDAELIRDADYGAATGAAPEEIKQLANYVTCTCEEGAVADFINKISLFMKGSSVWTR